MPTGTKCVDAELTRLFRAGFCSALLFTKVLVAQLVIAKEVDENPSVPSSTSVRACMYTYAHHHLVVRSLYLG